MSELVLKRNLARRLSKGTKTSGDTMLTPPALIKALGPFNMDVACPPNMPWKTAEIMLTPKEDGLATSWKGRVWCNPPYSDPMPWVLKMAKHNNGIMLLPATSPETRWCQEAFKTGSLFFFFKGRLAFHYVTGEQLTGKWMPNMLVAFGKSNVAKLANLKGWDGQFAHFFE